MPPEVLKNFEEGNFNPYLSARKKTIAQPRFNSSTNGLHSSGITVDLQKSQYFNRKSNAVSHEGDLLKSEVKKRSSVLSQVIDQPALE
jgi:hypothetical protein